MENSGEVLTVHARYHFLPFSVLFCLFTDIRGGLWLLKMHVLLLVSARRSAPGIARAVRRRRLPSGTVERGSHMSQAARLQSERAIIVLDSAPVQE